jgi:DNA-binding response OmpR family regulator
MLQIEVIRIYKNKRCLVIDDYPDIRASIKRMLNKFGAMNVDTASTGEEAIELCQKYSYDIVLADFNLGEKKSGQQILEEIRYRNLLKHSSLYIMITAETTRDKVYSAIENQPDAYIAKPFTPPILQKRLDALLIIKESLAEIDAAADARDYDRAINLCRQRIAEHDKYETHCIKILGNLLCETGRFEEAADVYKAVLKERSLNWALIGLGRAMMRKGQLDQSEEIFRKLRDERCPCLEVYDNLAFIANERGNALEAQGFMEEAIAMSPESILRQKDLATICEKNDDIERAEKAYRKVLRIGAHSVYEEPQDYFKFVSCTNKMMTQTGYDKKRFDDAGEMLTRAVRRFRADGSVLLRAKYMMSDTCMAAGKKDKATEALADAEKTFQEMATTAEVGPEVLMQRARTFEQNGDKAKAKEILLQLAAKFGDNQEIMEEIDRCLDEPVSKQGKVKVVEFNREGKKLFEKEDYVQAIDYFVKALKIYPNHVALNLNLAMALLREMNKNGADPVYLSRCKRVMTKIGELPTTNEFHALWLNIKNQVDKFK